jgi:hypothetical protein
MEKKEEKNKPVKIGLIAKEIKEKKEQIEERMLQNEILKIQIFQNEQLLKLDIPNRQVKQHILSIKQQIELNDHNIEVIKRQIANN